MNRLDLRQVTVGLATLLLLLEPVCLPAAPSPGTDAKLLPGWEMIEGRPDLTEEERQGARFAGQHLPIELFHALPPGQQKSLLRYARDHSDGHPSLAICWEENAPTAVVKPFLEIEYAGKLVRAARKSQPTVPIGLAFQADDAEHWSRTATDGTGQNTQGLPITLTWSLVPDGTLIPGGQVSGEASNEPSNLRGWLAGIYGGSSTGPASEQPWFPIFQTVFDNLSAKTGLRYVYEPQDDGATLSAFSSGQGVLGVRGDVRISGHRLDGNYNVLAYNYYPDQSDMVLDTSDSFFNNTANNSRSLRNVVEHEHGHGLGLDHVCPKDATKLMEPYINLGFAGIQFDDIFTLQRLYGDFLEPNGLKRDNDSFLNATPLLVPVGVPFSAQWLGIDDNTDTDYFRLEIPPDSRLTVRVRPSTAAYLEGAQDSSTGDCSAGTPFDSSTSQDLSLTVLGPDQSTVIGSAAQQPAGAVEEAAHLVIHDAGTYYLRVTGNGLNVNQLYRLEVEVDVLTYAIQLDSSWITQELWPVTNGVPDPGETLRLEVALMNIGIAGATQLNTTLTGPPGFQGFEVASSYGDLAAGEIRSRPFTFALNGSCGERLDLNLHLEVDGSSAGSIPLTMILGTETLLFEEGFETSTNPPPGWVTTETGAGSLWLGVASPGDPEQQSVFARDNSLRGQSTLTSPPIVISTTPGKLVFRHFYDTELERDGGVLEIQVGDGDWQDILTAGGSFLSGGYNLMLSGSLNPLGDRSAWSGNSGGFITSVVQLPPSAAHQTVHFRWILGHDRRTGGNGWYLEEVHLSQFACATGSPALTLSSTDDTLSEYFTATDSANVTFAAALPVATDIPISLQVTGNADPALDLTGLGDVVLTAGQASTTLLLRAVSDGIVEGTELLHVSSPQASGSVQLTLLDTPYGQFASTQLGTTGLVNPFDDFDADGFSNIEELVFGSEPASRASRPTIEFRPEGADFKLSVPLSTLPQGILVEAETSTNLETWLPDNFTVLPDGFQIPGGDPQRFLRLKYTVRETAP